MRIIHQIPHPKLTINVFSWNEKYILKFEIGAYEQSYKINHLDVNGVEDIERMVTEDFIESVMMRFVAMRKDFTETYNAELRR